MCNKATGVCDWASEKFAPHGTVLFFYNYLYPKTQLFQLQMMSSLFASILVVAEFYF